MTYVTHKNDHVDIGIASAFETMEVLKLFPPPFGLPNHH